MSNKEWNKLCWADRALRRLFPTSMKEGIDCKIELNCGFELFNTRSYHNYETWSNGYTIIAYDEHKKEVAKVSAEDLDDAIKILAKRLGKEKEIEGGMKKKWGG